MLVLSRLVDERIRIDAPNGEVITIVICAAKPSNVRIGIDAPRNYVIRRQELVDEADEPCS